MITVLHRGGLANDSSIPRILGFYIKNIISIALTENSDFFSIGKKSFLGGVSMIISFVIGEYHV